MSKFISTKERELVGRISEWFNETIKRNNFPFKSSSVETSLKVGENKTRFGNLILRIDRETSKVPRLA